MIKRFQHSLFMWFLLSYGTMYVISLFVTQNIYSKFEDDYIEGIASEAILHRTHTLSLLKEKLNPSTAEEFSQLISTLNNLPQQDIYSTLVHENATTLPLEKGLELKNPNWKKITNCSHHSTQCDNSFFHAHALGLETKYEDYILSATPIKLEGNNYFLLNSFNPSKINEKNLEKIRTTEHILQLVIFLSFICYIFISVFAVRPISQFIKKMKSHKLQSKYFRFGRRDELNHVRTIRHALYEALLRKEQNEAERITMQNALYSQQKEAEIGKIVSQISHDLKSPLIIFEEILRENSYENFSQNYHAAKRSLNKIFSLIYSLKQADKESLISKSFRIFSLESIVDESKAYSKTKKLLFESHISFSGKTFFMDHQKVERSVNNLLRNAVEYAKSKIIFKAEIQDDVLIFQITDDGPGVPKEILPQLFQWRNTSNLESGTGIGLFYAKQVALAHGGDLNYEHKNGRTIFTITLPGVEQVEGVQSSNPLALPEEDLNSIEFKEKTQKFVVFFLKNEHLHDSFYEFMQEKQLLCVFFKELSETFEQTPCSILYTDCAEALTESLVEQGVHVILSQEHDNPAQIYSRIMNLSSYLGS